MSEMVERVARSIYEATPRNKPWSLLSAMKRQNYEAEARAAISAMREPTEAMTTAGWEPSNNKGPYHCWAAMIDEALK